MTKELVKKLTWTDVPREENFQDVFRFYKNKDKKLFLISGCDMYRVRIIVNAFINSLRTIKSITGVSGIVQQITYNDENQTLPAEFFKIISKKEFQRNVRDLEARLTAPDCAVRYQNLESVFQENKSGIIVVKNLDDAQSFIGENFNLVKPVYIRKPGNKPDQNLKGIAHFTDIDLCQSGNDSFCSKNLLAAQLD